jgi:hypothetical protein
MKILAIGIHSIPGTTDSNLIQSNVFEDYDAVIVNPDSLYALYGDKYRTHDESHRAFLDEDFASYATQVNSVRHEQARGLMQKNGLIICFLQPPMVWTDPSQRQILTNYDWLFHTDEIAVQFNEITYGTGTTIDYINPSHPFTQYLLTKPHWKAYIQKAHCDQEKWKILASAFDTHLLSLASTAETGSVILLPSGHHTENGELLQQCIKTLLGDRDITPTPEWAESIVVPCQDKILKALAEIDTQINTLNQKQSILVSKNIELQNWKWLLYETGKHRLQPIVLKAFSLLGCNAQPEPDSDSDGRLQTEFGTALLEIEGANETIKINKISQLLKNIANFLAQQGVSTKGILVGNPFRTEELSNRPPKGSQKKLFSDQVLTTAEMHNISVLLSTDLYEIVCLILDNKLTTQQIKSVRQRIFQGKGLISLCVR